MFAWVGNQFSSILDTYVLGVVSALIIAITPLALTAMTIWVLLYGWAVLRQEVHEAVPTFLWKITKIGLVLAFALQSGFYIDNVSNSADTLAMGVATTFLPPGAPAAAISSPYALLDEFNDRAGQQISDIMREAGIFRVDLLLAGVVFSLGTVVFLCIALFVVTLAKVFLTFVIAVGPLFILALAWRPTQRFFDSWLSMVLNAVVLTWFAFFALGLSAFIGDQIFTAIQSGGGFLGNTFNVLGESLRYCVLMILMAFICFQAPSLASALTGGAAVQLGVQMIQNAMMVAGLRAATSPSRGATAPGAGGVVRAGTGLPYAAGKAVGTFATGASSLARRGYGYARTAAYRLASMRVRR
jgi:type IV secretion system protein VirB6